MNTTGRGGGVREVSRRAVQTEIARHAMRLFEEQGFDATTVEQVAATAGISSRSFFRYFAAKEDVVIGDPLPLGQLLVSAMESRPVDEQAGIALCQAVQALIETVQSAPELSLQSSRLMLSTASLRARHLEKQLLWQQMLVPETLRRLESGDAARGKLQAYALVSAALACLDVAVLQWAAGGGAESLGELFAAAVDAVTSGLRCSPASQRHSDAEPSAQPNLHRASRDAS